MNVSFDVLCEVFFTELRGDGEVTQLLFGNDFLRIVFHLPILSDELEDFYSTMYDVEESFCQIKKNFFGDNSRKWGNLTLCRRYNMKKKSSKIKMKFEF